MADFPNDPDGFVLAELAADGVDLSQPMLIEFTIDAPDEGIAAAIESSLEVAGFQSEVYHDAGEADDELDFLDDEFGESWTVYVKQMMVPEHSEIVRIQNELAQIADSHGGSADGWGAAVA